MKWLSWILRGTIVTVTHNFDHIIKQRKREHGIMKGGNKRKEKEIQENPKWYVERADKGKGLQKKRCVRECRYARIGDWK